MATTNTDFLKSASIGIPTMEHLKQYVISVDECKEDYKILETKFKVSLNLASISPRIKKTKRIITKTKSRLNKSENPLNVATDCANNVHKFTCSICNDEMND